MKSYALAGASKRALEMYGAPITSQFADSARLAGVFDVNPGRAAYLSRECGGVPAFDDFDAMLEHTRPDSVIVVTMDCYHHEYIVRALDAGCSVITEKPMVIDDAQTRAVLAAEQRAGKQITVTFNYRFMPYVTRVKELLREGAIGRLLNVDFEWYLDRKHGADYFRRWHRRKENSGGLLVTKATHHFDIINWWLEDDPARVEALGRLQFYGPTRPERGARCSTCTFAESCEFYVDLASDAFLKQFYFEAEQFDGYHRDQCVFAEEIDIEDTMNVVARYKNGAQLSYSLVAYSPYEGWRATLTGTKGRMELREDETGPLVQELRSTITVCNTSGELTSYDVPRSAGDHGGGDDQILERLFGGRAMADPLDHMAGSWAGAMSVLIGAAANRSMVTGEVVNIDDLLRRMS